MLPDGKKYLALTDPIMEYVDKVRTHDGDELLAELRNQTAQFGDDAVMQIPDQQGTFMTLLTRMISAKTALEIGTFTGHSSICIARGLPEGGRLICMDMSQQWTNVAKSFWEKAGVASKIDLQIGDAIESLEKLDPAIRFDLVHIDAEKTLYDDFFEAALPKVRSGGVFVFDNMLRGGRVIEENSDDQTEAIKSLNQKLSNDSRVETVLVTIGDGIQLCRKK